MQDSTQVKEVLGTNVLEIATTYSLPLPECEEDCAFFGQQVATAMHQEFAEELDRSEKLALHNNLSAFSFLHKSCNGDPRKAVAICEKFIYWANEHFSSEEASQTPELRELLFLVRSLKKSMEAWQKELNFNSQYLGLRETVEM
jgi:hypothetical protein